MSSTINLHEFEIEGKVTIFCHDWVGMRTAVAMNVFDRFLETFDHLDSAFQSSVFGAQRFGWRWAECQVFAQRRAGVYFHLNSERQINKRKDKNQWRRVLFPTINTPSFFSMVHTSEKKELPVPFPPSLPNKSSWIRSVSMALQADG